MEEGSVGPIAIVADCPSAAYLPSLLASPAWDSWRHAGLGNDDAGASSTG